MCGIWKKKKNAAFRFPVRKKQFSRACYSSFPEYVSEVALIDSCSYTQLHTLLKPNSCHSHSHYHSTSSPSCWHRHLIVCQSWRGLKVELVDKRSSSHRLVIAVVVGLSRRSSMDAVSWWRGLRWKSCVLRARRRWVWMWGEVRSGVGRGGRFEKAFCLVLVGDEEGCLMWRCRLLNYLKEIWLIMSNDGDAISKAE